MTPTQPDHNGILRQVLDLPKEQKALLLDEILQSELSSSSENDRPFLDKLDEALTRLEAKERMQSEMTAPERVADVQNSASRQRPDPAPAMVWLRLHSKEYGGQWVALDLIDYIEPTDALPFVF